jgi:hypothetical protein
MKHAPGTFARSELAWVTAETILRHFFGSFLMGGSATFGAIIMAETPTARTAIKGPIGLRYGEVVLSDIGSERRLELGDAVNVSSLLGGCYEHSASVWRPAMNWSAWSK